MKKNSLRVLLLIFLLIALMIYFGYYRYSLILDDVKIIQYFDSVADNINYQTVRIRAVVPEERCRGNKTMNVIRVYVTIRSKNVPDRIDILLYDNMEKFSDCESYSESSFKKSYMEWETGIKKILPIIWGY